MNPRPEDYERSCSATAVGPLTSHDASLSSCPFRSSGGEWPGAHSFYWFNECDRDHDGQFQSLCIEGTVTFDDLLVLRADGSPIPIEEFIADSQRYWAALHAGDERLSVRAQRTAQAGTPKWRSRAIGATTVTGTLATE